MTSQVGRVIHDQNLNAQSNGASVVGKTDTVKTQRKGGLGGKKSLGDLSNSGKPAFNQVSKKQHSKNFATGASIVGKGDVLKTQMRGLGGRKPLGDISNSGKPILSQASKKQPSKNFPVVEEVTSLPKIVHDASTRKGVFKASEKVQTHSRNTLSHISNSVKPNLQKNHSMKLKVMAEEPLCPSAIAEEGFLHNHQECIKAQNKAMDLDQLLMNFSELKPESPLRCKNLEEMSEKLDSPPPVFESPKYFTPYEDFDELSDKLDYPPIDYTDFPWISEDCDFKLMSPNH
ncbi:unnamed protein product [Prunus armeniaca]